MRRRKILAKDLTECGGGWNNKRERALAFSLKVKQDGIQVKEKGETVEQRLGGWIQSQLLWASVGDWTGFSFYSWLHPETTLEASAPGFPSIRVKRSTSTLPRGDIYIAKILDVYTY